MYLVGLIISLGLAFAAPSTRIGQTVEFPRSGGEIRFAARDAQGNFYLLGQTRDGSFPLVNPLQSRGGSGNCSVRPNLFASPCGDLFLAKLDSSGRRILFSTYLGTDGPDLAAGLALDANNNIWVAFTYAEPFRYLSLPTSGNLRVLKIAADGSRILAQRDINGNLTGVGLIVSKQDQVFVAGTKLGNASPDGFLLQLDTNAQVISTMLIGGSQADSIQGIQVAPDGIVLLAGTTASQDFPTRNAAQTQLAGASDAFLMMIQPATSTILNSTYWGGNQQDAAVGLGTDALGNAYLLGSTSVGFSRNAVFAAKFEKDSGRNLYSNYLGGSVNEEAISLAVSPNGSAWILGISRSTDFPIVDGIQPSMTGNNYTLALLSAEGNRLEYSTFLPKGKHTGLLSLPEAQSIWLIGASQEGDASPLYASVPPIETPTGSVFLNRLEIGPPPPVTPGLPLIETVSQGGSYLWSRAVSWGGIVTVRGLELAPKATAHVSSNLPYTLESTQVTLSGILAPLYYVSPTQINLQVPLELPLGPASLVITREGKSSSPYTVLVQEATPGIFTVDGSGSEAPIIVRSSNYSLVNRTSPAKPGDILSIFLAGLGKTSGLQLITGLPNPMLPAGLLNPVLGNEVLIDGAPTSTLYAGIAPGYVGLYQVNFRVPADLAPGKHRLSVGGSNEVLLFTN